LPKGRKLALTLGAATGNYIERLEAGSGKNIAIKRRRLRMHLKPFFGAMRLDAITSFMVERYKKKRIDAGSANGTVNRELATSLTKTGSTLAQELHRALKGSRQQRPQSGGKKPELQGLRSWRPEAESNRCTRICSPLHSHSAIRPARGGI
jgi:hypothetical protein